MSEFLVERFKTDILPRTSTNTHEQSRVTSVALDAFRTIEQISLQESQIAKVKDAIEHQMCPQSKHFIIINKFKLERLNVVLSKCVFKSDISSKTKQTSECRRYHSAFCGRSRSGGENSRISGHEERNETKSCWPVSRSIT